MSSLKVRQIHSKIRSMFEGNLDLYGISPTDKERDVKILSRYLAAFAVYSATGCSTAEASSSVWDGGDDNGIDAAYFDQFDSQVIIVQSKWIQSGTGEPQAKEISNFADGIKDLVENDIDSFGDRLKSKAEAVSHALMQPGTTIRIILVTTGASEIAEHGTRKVTKFLEELNDGDDDGIATFQVMGMQEVFAGLATGAHTGKINLTATLLDWSRISHPHSAYFGTIDGSQLKTWWTQHGKRIVAKNIRYALGDTDVNNQIKTTASSDPERFWYFNNGITLIADEASKAPSAAASHSSGNFEFKGASIVNGAQTVSTLAKIEDDDALGKVKVSTRVVLLKGAPDKSGADVTRTNNLQNRVEGRDFVSSDPEQNRIVNEMSMEGIEYQIHRTDSFNPTTSSCDLLEVTTALACASPDPSHSVAAKTGIGRFFNDLSKAPYKAIFNAQTSGARAFNAVRILRAIEVWIGNKKRNSDKKSGYAWGVLVHGNRAIAASVFNKLGDAIINCPISDLNQDYEAAVISTCEDVYTRTLTALEHNYPNRALAVLFKSPSNCKDIYETVASGN